MKRYMILVSVLMALSLSALAEGLEAAEELTLPPGLKRIEDSAFEGDASIQTVSMSVGVTAIGARAFAGCKALTDIFIPNSVETIGAEAFANCAALTSIDIPDSVESIGANAFSGCPEDIQIVTTPGSAAMIYAGRNRLDYNANTTYRALVIGQTYERYFIGQDVLVGGKYDVEMMVKMLKRFGGTPYACTSKHDLTGEEITAAIAQTFGSAQAQDVSLFYFSGHGTTRGALVGSDSQSITPDALRAALDAIPGRKIVIVDACYSGKLIAAEARDAEDAPAEADAQDAPEQFVSAFMAAFVPKGVKKGLAADDYYVMTASAATETSTQWILDDGTGYSAFTDYLCKGCEKGADQNGNGVVTIDEAYQYAQNALAKDKDLYNSMHAQVYPTDCRWFGFLRR